MSAEPDIAVINCKVTAQHKSYTSANAELNRRLGLLRQAVEKRRFQRSDLTTTDFRVDRKRERESNTYREIFLGYEATHSVELRLPLDKDRLNEVVEALLSNDARATVDIALSVSDPKPIRAKQLAGAVQKAKQRAEVVALAAEVKIGAILSIHYGTTEVRVTSQSFQCEEVLRECDSFPDIEPESFAVQDKVIVTQEILQ